MLEDAITDRFHKESMPGIKTHLLKYPSPSHASNKAPAALGFCKALLIDSQTAAENLQLSFLFGGVAGYAFASNETSPHDLIRLLIIHTFEVMIGA